MDNNYYSERPDVVQPAPVENNTLGVTGLVTGILGLVFAFCCSPLGVLLAVVALVCGIMANGRRQKFAIAGIVLGAIALVLGVIMSIFFAFGIMGMLMEGASYSTY